MKRFEAKFINLDKPYIGMLFNEEEDEHIFYTNYTHLEGLGIDIKSSNKGMDGKFKFVTLVCSRAGKGCVIPKLPYTLNHHLNRLYGQD